MELQAPGHWASETIPKELKKKKSIKIDWEGLPWWSTGEDLVLPLLRALGSILSQGTRILYAGWRGQEKYVYGERDWRENRWRVLMIADQEMMIGIEEIWWTSVYLVNEMVGLLMKGD